MRGITGIGHVAIKVKDIDRSLAFYTGILEFPEMLRLKRDDGGLWLIYLRITEDQYLELFPNAEGDRAPGLNANGLNHFCLTVADLDDVVARVVEKGVTLYRPVKTGADGNRQAWLEDPDGNRIEFMEMHPDCLQFDGLKRLAAERV